MPTEPLHVSIDIEILWRGEHVDASLDLAVYPGRPSTRRGHPDTWSPAEPGDYEIEAATVYAGDEHEDGLYLGEGHPLLLGILDRHDDEIRAEIRRTLGELYL